jgi:outer membrane protein insertion porin family
MFAAGPPPLLVESVAINGPRPDVALSTQVGRPYDAATVSRDVHRLWSLGRYSDVRAETDASGNVVFRTTSKPQVRLREVRIEPNSFGLQAKGGEGSPIDDQAAWKIALDAKRQLQARGYPDARVTYTFARVNRSEVDLKLHVQTGTAVRVKQLTFEGDPGMDTRDLSHSLRALRTHRILFWKMLPDYTVAGVDYDVARLRSFYLSKGYYDVRVTARDPQIDGKDATIRVWIESGQRYAGAPDPRSVCSGFFAQRRASARQGVLNFSARMHVDLSGGVAHVTTRADLGPRYRVGRIEFTGNHRTPDSTLRSNLVLSEAEPMDDYLLRKSIARLNHTGLIEPIEMPRVLLQTSPERGVVNVTIPVVERKRGSWNLSGPVGLPAVSGPLEATISAHLPSWGRGIFELSTYAVSISAIGLYRPVLSVFGPPKNFFLPLIALRRPFLPGESWTSGIVIAPQLGWQSMLVGYGATQFQERALEALAGNRGLVPDIPVTVETPHGEGVMFCEAPKPRLSTLRIAGSILVRLPSALAGF